MTVYIGARDLSGVPIGTHQFIVLSYSMCIPPIPIGDKLVQPKPLGNGVSGIVIGAQNRGRLVVEFFEPKDFTAAKEFFDGSEVVWYKADLDAELREVQFGGLDVSSSRDKVIALVDTYILNQKTSPITYPTAGMGVNSNSWVQSVIEYAGGKVNGNMSGFDISHDLRIPRTYFQPVCPIEPRPRVN